jgi:hypothetical protein
MVIDFEIGAWLIWNLSEGQAAKNHSRARRDLIEINSFNRSASASTAMSDPAKFPSLACD